MNLLLDTQAFLWLATEPERVPARAVRVVKEPSNELFLSVASIWEMAIKRSIGKLSGEMGLADLVSLAREKLGLRVLDMTAAHAFLTEHLPFHHRDPFDRLLVAQARAENMAIVSSDSLLDDYGVRRIWGADRHPRATRRQVRGGT